MVRANFKTRVLVISPHPDDEVIGCGGTLRRHIENSDVVQVIFLTSGENGVRGQPPDETARRRETEAAKAARIIGYRHIEFWREPDGAVRSTRVLVNRLRKKVNEWRPQILYLPHEAEMHPDHRAAARIARRALTASMLRKIETRMYEVWTPLQQIDHVEDISKQIEVKIAAIRAHRSQCKIMRFDEAARGLSRYRGEMHSWPGGPHSEVFKAMQ